MRAFVRKQQKACAARNGFRHKFCNGLFIPPDRYSDHPADKQYIGKMKKKEGKMYCFFPLEGWVKALLRLRGRPKPPTGAACRFSASGLIYRKMKKKEGKCISRCSAGLLCALQAKWIVCEHKK